MNRATPLHPLPMAEFNCPSCDVRLVQGGWLIPGMRNLVDLKCPRCGDGFYGDLPAGQALYTPMLLAKRTGAVHDAHGVPWFSDWLRQSYADRSTEQVSLRVIDKRPIKGPAVVLNCLDTLYGHSLLKLLNVQYYLDQPDDIGLIVIVPGWLSWMVPEGVAQIWVVERPIKIGIGWYDSLAAEISRRVVAFPEAWLAHALSHPQPSEYDINRFTGVEPFDLHSWDTAREAPSIAFIWREDRTWQAGNASTDGTVARSPIEMQHDAVTRMAVALRDQWPALRFAVAGLGAVDVAFPSWIDDLRFPQIDVTTERTLCELYARCHLVIGVHGSNMLLPSAHAGGVIELLGPERYGNFPQDILFRDIGDSRELLFRYRFVDPGVVPEDIAQLASIIVRKRSAFFTLMNVRDDV